MRNTSPSIRSAFRLGLATPQENHSEAIDRQSTILVGQPL
jgi:hypothetical protein